MCDTPPGACWSWMVLAPHSSIVPTSIPTKEDYNQPPSTIYLIYLPTWLESTYLHGSNPISIRKWNTLNVNQPPSVHHKRLEFYPTKNGGLLIAGSRIAMVAGIAVKHSWVMWVTSKPLQSAIPGVCPRLLSSWNQFRSSIFPGARRGDNGGGESQVAAPYNACHASHTATIHLWVSPRSIPSSNAPEDAAPAFLLRMCGPLLTRIDRDDCRH